MASDGRWYPPELRAPQPPAPPTQPAPGATAFGLPTFGAPAVDPVAGQHLDPGPTPPPIGPPPANPYGAPPSVPPGPYAPPAASRRPTIRWFLIAGAAVVLLVAAIALDDGFTHQPGTVNLTTAPTTVAGQQPDPAAAVLTIGLQPSDLGSGYTQNLPGRQATRNPPSPCTPVSSSPFVAGAFSPQYRDSTGDTLLSTITLVLPSPGDATAALTAVAAPSYLTSCFEPAQQSTMQSTLQTVNQSTGCDLTDLGSSATTQPTSALPTGTVAYEFSEQVQCGATGEQTTFDTDVDLFVRGPVLVQLQCITMGVSCGPMEQQVLWDIAPRAVSY